jgi:ribonuclease-3 family protein
VGDSVFELFVRTFLVEKGISQVNKLHRGAIDFVSAKAQSQIFKGLMEELTEEEIYIFKRGRNAKAATIPKNANITDYRIATGLEALVGYIYLKKDYDRIKVIFNRILELKKGETE